MADVDTPEPLPVEGKPEEPSDELERKLLPSVDSEEAEELAKIILSDHLAAIDDRTEWESRLVEWEEQLHGIMPPKDFPWPGAANFHVPLTMMGVETYKPRLIEAVMGNEPPIQVVPVDSTDETRRDRVELFLNWAIRTEMDIRPTVAESAHLFMIPGTVFAKTTWEANRRHRSYTREFPLGTPLDEIMTSLWGDKRPDDLEQVPGKPRWHGTIATTPRSGGPLDVEFTLKFLPDGVQVMVEEEYTQERPDVSLIDAPDFIAPAKGGSDIQKLPWCQHRLWQFESDLRRLAAQGRYDKDVVEELLKVNEQPSGDLNQQDTVQYRETQANLEGIEDQGASNVRQSQYEILEDYRYYDINDDGVDEHVITWYAKDLPGKVLGWDLVDNVYAHGRRPFRAGRFYALPFRLYGLSFAEVIRGIQDEANTMHNQRVDYGTIQNLPFFFYRASSTLAPFPARLRPGEGVPIDNPATDINIPHWQGSPAFGQQEEALLLQYWERVTGLTDLSLGRQPTRVGATRTAAGTSQLLSESGLRQKTALEEFQRFWTGIFEDVLALYQEYLPAGKEFRVTGRLPEYIRLKDRSEIQGRYDIRLTMTTQTMNRVVAREDATTVLQALLNPGFMMVGMVGLKGIQRALGDFLRAYGKDPDAYLEPRAAPKSPEEELATLVSGGEIKPVAGEDIQHHLQAHQQQLMDPLARNVLRPDGVAKLERHVQETVMLAQSMLLAQQMNQSKPGAQQSQQPGGPPNRGDAVEARQGQQALQPNANTNLPAMGQGAPPSGQYQS